VPRTQAANNFLSKEFEKAGEAADSDVWEKYSLAMKRPTSYEQQLLLWEEMAGWDMMAAALIDLVEEAAQYDANNSGTLWYECNESEVEDDLNDMLKVVDSESIISSQIYGVAGRGNHFEKIEYATKEGVTGLSNVHPIEVRRCWLKHNRRCIGYKWDKNPANHSRAFVMPDGKTEIPRISLASGQNKMEDLWYPWDFLHFRRLFRMRDSEHGEPIFDDAQGIYRKLRMALDQMVVHRAQVQPDRYVVNIDTNELPPTEQMKMVHKWKQSFRSKQSFGQAGTDGSMADPTSFKSFYNPLALDTVLWVARPKGFNHSIEKLAGTPNVPDVFDIELLTDLFYSIIGMPKSWFGINKDAGQAPSGKSLLAQDIRSLRKVRSIRRPIINGYTWLGYFHSVLKGRDVSKLNIQAKMSEIGGLEDQMRMELLQAQADVLNSLGDVMDKYNLPKDAWTELVFKRYMHLPDEVVNVFLTALPAQKEPMMPESKSRVAIPSEAKLIQEISDKLTSAPCIKKMFVVKGLAKDMLEDGKPNFDKNITTMPKISDGMSACLPGRTEKVYLSGAKAQVNGAPKALTESLPWRAGELSPAGGKLNEASAQQVDTTPSQTIWTSDSWRKYSNSKHL